MKNLLKDYIVTLTSIALTLLLEIAGSLYFSLSLPEQYIIITVGAMSSLIVFALERKMSDTFKSILEEKLQSLAQGLELYRLLNIIDDKVLQEEVMKLARSFSIGEIPANMSESRARELIKRANKSLMAVDYPSDVQSMISWWNGANGRTWYASNVEAINRGVLIERHFLLKKSEAEISPGKLHPYVLEFLQRQANDGILVRVLWIEEVLQNSKKPSDNILQDLVIFDEEEASASNSFETKVYRRPSDKVAYYIKIFKEQRDYCYNLDDLKKKAELRVN